MAKLEAGPQDILGTIWFKCNTNSKIPSATEVCSCCKHCLKHVSVDLCGDFQENNCNNTYHLHFSFSGDYVFEY